VDVTNDTKRRFGAPHVAVNPKNPDNIVVLASSSLGYTRACVPAPPGSDCEMIAAGSPLLTQPRGGMALDSHGGAYVVWADWTPGERSIFFSAINVNAFEL
jgi:hypothetical protein